MAEDDDRPGDASSAADASWTDVVVPDDISSLAADVEAYRREVRRARRRAWQARVMSRPGILPLSIVSIALLLAGIVATLLTVLAPSAGDSEPASLPLAHTRVADGSVGGLVPAVALSELGQPVKSQALRPAVVALVPATCNCVARLKTLAGQADQVGYPLDVVTAATPPAGADSLIKALDTGKPHVLLDASQTNSLYDQVAAVGLTLLLVQPNGVIYDKYTNVVEPIPDLNARLQTMKVLHQVSD
jgi:hypothetical protein